MEKQDILKTRVPAKLRSDFEDICTARGVLPSAQLREIIEEFVGEHYSMLEDRIAIHIHRPDDFQFGAWRVLIKLRNPEEMIWNGSCIPFALPNLEKRIFQTDPDYRSVLMNPETKEYMLGGKFNGGEFKTIMYSNGCSEEDNPSPIDLVRETFRNNILDIADRFK